MKHFVAKRVQSAASKRRKELYLLACRRASKEVNPNSVETSKAALRFDVKSLKWQHRIQQDCQFFPAELSLSTPKGMTGRTCIVLRELIGGFAAEKCSFEFKRILLGAKESDLFYRHERRELEKVMRGVLSYHFYAPLWRVHGSVTETDIYALPVRSSSYLQRIMRVSVQVAWCLLALLQVFLFDRALLIVYNAKASCSSPRITAHTYNGTTMNAERERWTTRTCTDGELLHCNHCTLYSNTRIFNPSY